MKNWIFRFLSIGASFGIAPILYSRETEAVTKCCTLYLKLYN